MDIQNFVGKGLVSGLTFKQAAAVVGRATGNVVIVNPFDARSIERAALGFGDNNSGSYPGISARDSGGFEYTTISGRTLSVYPDEEGWTLDCSGWWSHSENFRATVEECFSEVFQDEGLRDTSLPVPEPEHVHASDGDYTGELFTIYYTPVNNHGCSGFSVEVEATSSIEGKVMGGDSCSSCWQVGHDRSGSPVEVGSFIRLPDGYCWLCASGEDPDFMSSRDVSRNGRTMVRPSDLIIVDRSTTRPPTTRTRPPTTRW